MRRLNQFLYHLFLRVVRRVTYVGTDLWGNRYYTTAKKNGGKERRFVVYGQSVEASTVPPAWHGWLHHTTDDHPGTPEGGALFEPYPWQKTPLPDLTGTVFQHVPPSTDIQPKPDPGVWRPS